MSEDTKITLVSMFVAGLFGIPTYFILRMIFDYFG